MAYQICINCSYAILPTKARVYCVCWNKWEKYDKWCKQFVDRKKGE